MTKARGIRWLGGGLTHSLSSQWLCCWSHIHLFSHHLVLGAMTPATLDGIGRCVVFVLSWLCANSRYNAEINPYFTLSHWPAWHIAVVKRQNEDVWAPYCHVKFRTCAGVTTVSSCPQLLFVRLLLKTSIKGYKHQSPARSYSNLMGKHHLRCLRELFFFFAFSAFSKAFQNGSDSIQGKWIIDHLQGSMDPPWNLLLSVSTHLHWLQ